MNKNINNITKDLHISTRNAIGRTRFDYNIDG